MNDISARDRINALRMKWLDWLEAEGTDGHRFEHGSNRVQLIQAIREATAILAMYDQVAFQVGYAGIRQYESGSVESHLANARNDVRKEQERENIKKMLESPPENRAGYRAIENGLCTDEAASDEPKPVQMREFL